MTNKPNLDDKTKMMKPGQAASLLHVSTRTLTRMADRGDVSTVELPSGHRRYLSEEIEALATPHSTNALADSNQTAGARGGDAA